MTGWRFGERCFFLLKYQYAATIAAINIAPPTPAPIPAFAPAERPPLPLGTAGTIVDRVPGVVVLPGVVAVPGVVVVTGFVVVPEVVVVSGFVAVNEGVLLALIEMPCAC